MKETDYNLLHQQAVQIRDEVEDGRNTAKRVGKMFVDMVENQKQESDNINKNVNSALQAQDEKVDEKLNDLGFNIDNKLPLVTEDGFFVADKFLNAIIKYTKDGFDVAKLSKHFVSLIIELGIGDSHIVETLEDGFFFIDNNLNYSVKITNDGLDYYGKNDVVDSNEVDILDSIPTPQRVVRVDFYTEETMPTKKDEVNPIYAHGSIKVNFDGVVLEKYATAEVQGATSAERYPKFNYTFAFYNDKNFSKEYEFRVANMVAHSEYVLKANYIDSTQCRNIVCNRIWEQIVQSRKGYPKRETEFNYNATETTLNKKIDTGALGHVDGFPAVLYVNDEFYGIGTFNIGKKRGNYNLNKSTQSHMQMTAETHVNFNSYVVTDWEIRNPKTPDAGFANRLAPWFSSNALSGDSFKSTFESTHNKQNAIDYLLFIDFLYADDCVDKNFILTTWDGLIFSFMPYDLDTVFGLWWDGSKVLQQSGTVINSTNNISQTAKSFWNKFYSAYGNEIKSRYAELRNEGIFSVDNVYSLFSDMSKIWGESLFKKEQSKWTAIPSANTTSIAQVCFWVKNRLQWMDSYYV